MKIKISFFLLLVSLSIQLQAQKCKYDFDKVEPMSSERVRRITYSLENYFLVGLYRRADDFRVELNVRFVGERNFRVEAGDKIEIKLASGTILTLSAAEVANPVSFVGANRILTSYAITYTISKEEMQQIAENGFTVVRLKIGGEELVYEAGEKITKKSAAGAGCMLAD